MMNNRLFPILKQKEREVEKLAQFIQAYPYHDMAKLYRGEKNANTKSLKKALSGVLLAIIAEIKRKSPAKGQLAAISDPVALAKFYVEGGASALSILTDELFFSGSVDDLQTIAQTDFVSHTPLLRKDFIVDYRQIAEAAFLGADAILCIVAVLGEKTPDYVKFAHTMGLEVLVEVHDESELEIAIQSGTEIIGINNRNLTTFVVDTEQATKLVNRIPDGYIKVAESGIYDPKLAQDYHQAGFDAALIGEALVTSSDPGAFIRACRQS